MALVRSRPQPNSVNHARQQYRAMPAADGPGEQQQQLDQQRLGGVHLRGISRAESAVIVITSSSRRICAVMLC